MIEIHKRCELNVFFFFAKSIQPRDINPSCLYVNILI
jgi:hypothetical protein